MTDLRRTGIRDLGLDEVAAVAFEATLGPSHMVRGGEMLAAQGDPAAGLYLVVSGVLKACRNLDNGLAQTLALFTAGELMALQSLAHGRQSATLAAVSVARVALIPAAQVNQLLGEHPSLGRGLWRAMAREAAILQEWMVGMGRRSALTQIAHLLCEVAVRMHLAGKANGNLYDFPLTQTELADAVGLSPVHVNRILQTLRADGLIELSRGQLRIGDWGRMAKTADFDPAYLQLRATPGDSDASVLFPSGDARKARDRRDREQLPHR